MWFCVCVCEYESTLGPCMHMWKSEVDGGCPLLLSIVSPLLSLSFDTGPLNEPGVTVYASLAGQKFPGYAISAP